MSLHTVYSYIERTGWLVVELGLRPWGRRLVRHRSGLRRRQVCLSSCVDSQRHLDPLVRFGAKLHVRACSMAPVPTGRDHSGHRSYLRTFLAESRPDLLPAARRACQNQSTSSASCLLQSSQWARCPVSHRQRRPLGLGSVIQSYRRETLVRFLRGLCQLIGLV